MVQLRNAEGVPPANSQRHSGTRNHSRVDPDIARQVGDPNLKKLDRRFPHGAGRLDSNWLADEASAQLSVLGNFP